MSSVLILIKYGIFIFKCAHIWRYKSFFLKVKSSSMLSFLFAFFLSFCSTSAYFSGWLGEMLRKEEEHNNPIYKIGYFVAEKRRSRVGNEKSLLKLLIVISNVANSRAPRWLPKVPLCGVMGFILWWIYL